MDVPLLSRENLADAVIREIKHLILRSEIKPGDWLPPQPELAKRFGVGLSTLREAIKALALLGILAPQPGRGTQVNLRALSLLRVMDLVRTRLEELDILQVYEARRIIEVELSRLAAKRATEEDTIQIEKALEKMRQVVQDDQTFTEADLDFHFAVARAGKNQLLEEFYHVSRDMLAEALSQVIKIPDSKEISLRLQQEILDAIRSHDSRAAHRYADELTRYFGELVRASLSVGSDNQPQGVKTLSE